MSNCSNSITFNECLPIFSGVLGVWAEKAFPTLLIAPGSMYIQLKFAKASQAFQTAMDPCRRIFGTFRDYVPNWGLVTGYASDYGGRYWSDTKCTVASTVSLSNGAFTSTYFALTTAAANGTDFAWNGLI